MRLLRHRTVLFLLGVAVLWGGWQAFLAASAPGRLDGAVRLALDREPRVNVAVALGFPPEDFHVRLFQGYGVVSGVRGTTRSPEPRAARGRAPDRALLLGPADHPPVRTR